MQPQVSISTAFSYDIPIEEQIPLIAEAGFSAISLGHRQEHSGYSDPAKQKRLKDSLRQFGMTIDTVHAPLLLDRQNTIAEIKDTAQAAADLGAHCVVAHGGPFDFSSNELDERLWKLVDMCHSLVPVAQSCGITFALENVMPGPATDLVRKALHELDNNIFGLCYDSSHDQIDGPRPFDLLDEFQERVFAVHLSDRIKPFVDHVIPGEGFIHWPAMCQKLRSARYGSSVTLEVMMQHSQFKDPKVFLREACKAGFATWKLIYGDILAPTSL